MQEEVTQKTIALSVKTARVTADVLKNMLRKYLSGQKQKGKNPYKVGKQSYKELKSQGSGLSNIEITDGNIKSFERVAKKYRLDFALKKDSSTKPPTYYVFFKGQDTEMMNLAFKKYLGVQMNKKDKPSIMKKLMHFKDAVSKGKNRERAREQQKDRPKNPKYARNKNILVIGGSGSGKTRFFVKPNIMQMHSSYVITDPKGTVLLEVGSMLAKGSPMTDENGKIVRDKEGKVIYEPYKIKVLNTINFKKSMHYNPFVYIRSEKDILKLVTTIIANTKGEGQQSGEDFWVKAEKLYYCALIGYIWYEGREEEKNFNTLLEMINVSEAREDDENFKNPVDLMFDELEQKDPNHFAVRQYKKYKLAAGKTAKSILISCGARLAPFDIAELRELMSYDELELDLVGDRKTALFVIISDTDDTFNFIVSIMYTQLFNLLCDRADDVYGGRLPIHVRCLLDEFANIGQIPKFEKLIATIRSREISASIILQSKSQLKAIYKDNADTIEGNCDTTLFLGGKEKTTLKEIAEILGKETIDLYNTSDTRGSQRSYGMNYQKIGKELMSQDEIAVMDGGKCILQVRGVRPFFSNKYDICKHKNYKYLSDYDKKNTFDIEKYLSTNLILKPEDEVELYQM